MLRARREGRAGGPQDPRFAQDPRYGGRRYRDRNQYGPQYGPSQPYDPYYQQQYNQPPPYGPPQQQYQPYEQYSQPWQSAPQPQYSQQYGGQRPLAPSLNGPYPGNEVAVQQSQTYATQLPQLPPYQESSGPRPCVIPQITHKRFSGENMSPFVRVRVPELEHQISAHELIVFIDGLNEAFLANPALQTANNVANIGGMAPSMIVQMVSVGVNVAAGVGSAVTSKTRKKKFLAKANEELFNPRGLHVQVCKTDKMLGYIGLEGQNNIFLRQQYKTAFENAQQIPVNGPMSPAGSNTHPIMQRMASLGNHVMRLSFDNVEAAAKPDGFWKKWGAKEALKADQKQTEKILKDQAKEDRRAGRRGGRGSSRIQDRKDEKKAKEVKKILWIVITTKEKTAGGDDEWDSESESLESHKRE
ncbi:uncharacterized protein N7459_008146 [Penicillium hispanicum]|uniref:uncharacterized protein n=1 Tax=Penicillium hispanicum TaxID=1080232 RepID=UPI00254071D5|nr:uncharacterized protein N7459_008146 [Penicillium hispanicum]KAJ5573719.1 hypothetical protein N7459_008146 [Penicillium hispanicum]